MTALQPVKVGGRFGSMWIVEAGLKLGEQVIVESLAVAWLDLPGLLRHCVLDMKTISAQQAVQQFDEFSKLAHDGHKILVTREGEPWVILAPPGSASHSESGDNKLEWPDFEAHWKQHFPEPLAGPTATQLLL